MGVLIRPAVAEDIADLAALNRRVQGTHVQAEPSYFRGDQQSEQVAEFFRKLLSEKNNFFLVAVTTGSPVGYIWFEAQSRPSNIFKLALRRIYIHHIVVHENSQGRGVGASLLRAVETEAEAQGITHVSVDTWAFNAEAQAFFQRLGFEPFNIVMRKKVSGAA